MQERAKYVRELGDLPAERENQQAEQQLAGDIAGLERQVDYQQQDLAATRDRVKKLDADMAALQKVCGAARGLPRTCAPDEIQELRLHPCGRCCTANLAWCDCIFSRRHA